MSRKRKTPPRYKSGPKKGQFKPKGSRPSTKRKPSKRGGKRKTVAKKKTRRRRSRNTSQGFNKQAKDLMVGGAAYGYLTGDNKTAASLREQTSKLPELVNRDITNGIVLYFLNKHVVKNKFAKNMALAALVTGATKFGASGFSMEGFGVDGYDDAIDVDEMAGMLDPEEMLEEA